MGYFARAGYSPDKRLDAVAFLRPGEDARAFMEKLDGRDEGGFEGMASVQNGHLGAYIIFRARNPRSITNHYSEVVTNVLFDPVEQHVPEALQCDKSASAMRANDSFTDALETWKGPLSTMDNSGGGVVVIVYDFFSESAFARYKGTESMHSRPGGPPRKPFYLGEDARDHHGLDVAQQCAGLGTGAASGSSLVFISLDTSALVLLDYVARLFAAGNSSVVINCSFTSTHMNTAGSQRTQALFNRYLADFQRLAVVSSAGNHNDASCSDGRLWPSRYGRPHSFLMIGAARNTNNYFTSRRVEQFSNSGPCVDGYAVDRACLNRMGDARVKGYNQGTSFSCPVVSSLVALGLSSFPSETASEIVGRLRESAIRDQLRPANGAQDIRNNLLLVLPDEFSQGERVRPLVAPSDAFSLQMLLDWFLLQPTYIQALLCLALGVFLGAFLYLVLGVLLVHELPVLERWV
jgi:hypothetical protein